MPCSTTKILVKADLWQKFQIHDSPRPVRRLYYRVLHVPKPIVILQRVREDEDQDQDQLDAFEVSYKDKIMWTFDNRKSERGQKERDIEGDTP